MSDENKVVDITKELKRQERRKKWEARKTRVLEWWDDNKGVVVVVVPIVGGVIAKLIAAISKHHGLVMEQRNKDLRLYDTSLGHYWELKRKLKNDDWVTINRRRNLGESLGDILDEMRVLK